MVHRRGVDLFSLLSLAVIVLGLVIAYYKKYPLAQSLVLINLMVFLLTIMASWDTSGLSPVQTDLGFRPIYLEEPAHLFTIFTQMFVHGSLTHVLFNMLFLFLIGLPLEERVGRKAFALCYFVPGLIALVLETAIRGADSDILMLGASGAISGVMGALLFLYPKDEIPMFLGPIFLPKVPVWLSVGAWFAIQVVTLFTLPSGLASGSVAYGAHIGGFVAGMAMTQFLPTERKTSSAPAAANLSDLATTEELKQMQLRIESESEPQVRMAWLEHFAGKAKCPECGSDLTLEGNRIKCACGWERTVR
ncbi:MAG: rhomboid family intramembrane serine protease [Methanomassiliicoccales archaeon]|nr:rhomboid family intramembrane serine protease [Methanomassiliicoccales archaeon]